MRSITITWFKGGSATVGIPMTSTYMAVDEADARRQFSEEHPTEKVWSID